MINQILLGYAFPHSAKLKSAVTPFRLWPIDIDFFFHMNNASYIRVAELSRWRLLAESGLLSYMINKKIMFLAVEQSVTYARPILPFHKYNVTTTITVSPDDKWMHYIHSFDTPVDPKGTKEPVHYALVNLKAVMKESNGKTVKPSSIFTVNEYYRNLLKD
jgi:acyl-CoA thioesterase FadM